MTSDAGGAIEENAHDAATKALLLAEAGRHDLAIAEAQRARATFPDDPLTAYALGYALLAGGFAEAAITPFEEAATMAPDVTVYRYQLAHAYRESDRLADGERIILTCVADEPEEPDYNLAAAMFLCTRSPTAARKKRARAHIDTALRGQLENSRSYSLAARLLWTLHDEQNAIMIAEQGLAEDPGNDDLVLLLSHFRANASTGDKAKASRTQRQATLLTEATEVLAGDPENIVAREVVFKTVWWRSTVIIAAPMMIALLIALLAKLFLHSGDHLSALVVSFTLVLFFASLRTIRALHIRRHAPRHFLALLRGRGPSALICGLCAWAGWILTLIGTVSLLFARDPVLLRWMLVMLWGGAVFSAVATVLWHVRRDRLFDELGLTNAVYNGVNNLHSHRLWLSFTLWRNVLLFIVVAIIVFFGDAGGRGDATAAAMAACAGMLLAPLTGAFLTRRHEKRIIAGFVDGSSRPPGYLPPTHRENIPVVLAVLLMIVMLPSAAAVPVLPDERDADPDIVITSPSSNSVPQDEPVKIPTLGPVEIPTLRPLDIPTLVPLELPTVAP